MKSIFRPLPVGRVTITLNDVVVLNNKRNNIAPSAKEIAAKSLIGHPSAIIDKIQFFNGATLIHDAVIETKTILNPQEVQFTANIVGGLWAGLITEVALMATGIGRFAELTGLSINKLLNEPIQLVWKIKIL